MVAARSKFICIALFILICNACFSQTYDWIRHIQSDDGHSSVNALTVDQQGRVYLVGNTRLDTLTFETLNGLETITPDSNAGRVIFLVRVTSDNDIDLVLSWQPVVSAVSRINDVLIDPDGGFFVSGYFTNSIDVDPGTGVYELNSHGQSDGFLLKFDSEGGLEWAVQLGSTESGTFNELGFSGNSLIACGYFAGQVDLYQPSPYNIDFNYQSHIQAWFAKFSLDGQLIWFKHFDSEGNLAVQELEVDEMGNIYLNLRSGSWASFDLDPGSGTIVHSTNSLGNVYVKLDPEGNFQWSKFFDTNGIALVDDMAINDGTLWVQGYFQDTLDFDMGSGTAYSAADASDAWIIKMDLDGNYLTHTTLGGAGDDRSFDFNFNHQGNPIIVGEFSDSLKVNGEQISGGPFVVGQKDAFIMQLNADLEPQWVQGLGSSFNDSGSDVVHSNDGTIYFAGVFNDTVQIPLNDGPYQFVAENNDSTEHRTDIFLLKLSDYSGVSIEEVDEGNSSGVFPNPTTGDFQIKNAQKIGSVLVSDLRGRLIRAFTANEEIHSIDGPPGVYIVESHTYEGEVQQFKLIKK